MANIFAKAAREPESLHLVNGQLCPERRVVYLTTREDQTYMGSLMFRVVDPAEAIDEFCTSVEEMRPDALRDCMHCLTGSFLSPPGPKRWTSPHWRSGFGRAEAFLHHWGKQARLPALIVYAAAKHLAPAAMRTECFQHVHADLIISGVSWAKRHGQVTLISEWRGYRRLGPKAWLSRAVGREASSDSRARTQSRLVESVRAEIWLPR